MKKAILHQLIGRGGLKWLLNASILGFLLLFGLPASAQLLQDNFDTYDYGWLSITGASGGWYLPASASTSASVESNTFFESFPNSVYFTSEFNSDTEKTLSTMATGTLSFWFKASPDDTINSESINIYLKESGSIKLWFKFLCGGGDCSTWEPEVRNHYSGGSTFIGSFSTSTDFHFLSIDFTTSTANYTLDNGTPSGWQNIYSNFTGDIKTISLYGGSQTGKWRLWVDSFGDYFSAGSCGEGAYCGNCSSITSCENAGCYWLNETCFWFPVSPASGFSEYYASNTSFATPTAFVLNLVDFSKPFIETLGNWTSAFQENFNIASATASGLNLGLFIPEAKGYLDYIDSFFGDLPVGEFFTLLLTILILIIVFRVIKSIVGFLKP
jgi:hypothetical protein